MKKLDLYIIKKFLGTFFFMIMAFMIIAVIFDISENLDEFLKSKAPWYKIITHYYLNFCFYFATLLSSFIVFLTIIWFTSKLAQQSEIIAVLSGGISYSRFILPYFMAASILVVIMLLFTHIVVPRANRVKYDFEVGYLKDPLTVSEKNIHREITPGTIAYFYAFHPETNSGDNFSIETWEQGALKKKLMASSAQYNVANKTWTITNAQIRHYDNNHEIRLETRNKIDTILPMDDQDFGLRAEISSAMTMAELDTFINEQKLGGSGRVAQFEIEKYNRTAGPFAIFVLTLIGVSVASRKQRGGVGLHLMLAVVIGFIYVFISRMATVSAMNLGLSASLAVWIPNILFLFVGIFLYGKAQK